MPSAIVGEDGRKCWGEDGRKLAHYSNLFLGRNMRRNDKFTTSRGLYRWKYFDKNADDTTRIQQIIGKHNRTHLIDYLAFTMSNKNSANGEIQFHRIYSNFFSTQILNASKSFCVISSDAAAKCASDNKANGESMEEKNLLWPSLFISQLWILSGLYQTLFC